MVLPRYLKCSTLVSGLSSMVMVGGGVVVWCRLLEQLRLFETDCQAEELGCLGEAVQHPLQALFCGGQSSAKRASWRRVCYESTQVEEGAVQAVTNVDPLPHILDSMGQHTGEKDVEEDRG